MRSFVRSSWLTTPLSLLALSTGCGGSDTQPEVAENHGEFAPSLDAGDGPVRALPDTLADAGSAASDAALASADAGMLASDAGAPGDGAVPVSCPVEAPTSCPDPTAIRYPDVAPIIEARCASCHSPLWAGPWPLNTLSHVRDWADDIRTNLVACTMPPRDAGIPITKEERLTLLRWIRCGLPE